MKKFLILFVFSFCYISFVFPSDPGEENNNWTFNGGISFLIPADKYFSGDNDILSILSYSSVFAGVGYHINIIENIFSPGIYGDLHLNLGPLLFLLLFPSSQNEIDVETIERINKSNPFIILQTGIRIYNQFRIEYFDIQPFFGMNIISGSINTSILRTFGILFAYKNMGIEYDYQQFMNNQINDIKGSVHRIMFLYHLR